MNIVDMLVNSIISDTKWLIQQEESGDIFPIDDCFLPGSFDDAQELDVFQNPEPDTEDSHLVLENEPYYIEDTDVHISILGTYTHISSPGIITLNKNNIAAYWKSLLKYAQRSYPFIYPREAERILRLVVQSVYEHERFHYLCDFSRRLFNSTQDRLLEEALAVAATWHWMNQLKGSPEFDSIHPRLRRTIVQQRFQYTSHGYRDWHNYADATKFHDAVRDYLCPQASQVFATCGLDFGRWLLSSIPDDGNMACLARIREDKSKMVYGACSGAINSSHPASTGRIDTLVYALVEKYLKDFIPAPLLSEFDCQLRQVNHFLAQDHKLRHWVKNNTAMIGIWHGLKKLPVVDTIILKAVTTALYEDRQMKLIVQGKDKWVHPQGLVSREGVLYLVHTYPGSPENYYVMALHHIDSNPDVLSKRIFRDYDFALHDYLKNGFPFDLDTKTPILKGVELLFDMSLLSSLEKQPLLDAMTGQPVVIDKTLNNGWFKVTGSLPNNMALRWWLRGFGEENMIRVIQPDSLKMWVQGSLFDQLTGLPTRIATNHDLDRLISASQRTKTPFAVLMIDIDKFKKINDDYGHESGDIVLTEVASRLKNNLRNHDVLGRWGGEEFLVALTLDVTKSIDENKIIAMDCAEKLCGKMREKSFSLNKTPPKFIDVTISIGVRCIEVNGSSVSIDKSQILDQADSALYLSKKAGRDRSTLWDGNTS